MSIVIPLREPVPRTGEPSRFKWRELLPKVLRPAQVGLWTASFILTDIADGTLSLTADYSAESISAPQAVASVLKDVTAPTVSLDTPGEFNRITYSAYALSGSCSEEGREVALTLTDTETPANTVSDQSSCNGGTWAATVDAGDLGAGTVTIAVTHSDPAENEGSASGTATRDNDIIITLGDAPHIGEENESAYALSGTCSEEGEEVTVTVGMATPTPHQPSCSNFAWTTGLDVSGLDDGEMTITIVHGGATITQIIYKGCVPGGSGSTADDPVVICTYSALNGIRTDVDESDNLTKHYALGADIDASPSWSEGEEGCAPYEGVTIPEATDEVTPCTGWQPLPSLYDVSFDGRDYTISKLYINSSEATVGFFGQIADTNEDGVGGDNSIVINLHLREVRVHGESGDKVGGIEGYSSNHNRSIFNCSVTGEISGSASVGGLVGYGGNVWIYNSYSNVTVRGQFAGGLVGSLNQGTSLQLLRRGKCNGTGEL